ncbi:MAG TPA: hypothetical protein VM032_01985 [Vicinamibacterales bacterium]|nr:hypothetical protein [Vicinamibacterales bacterium]
MDTVPFAATTTSKPPTPATVNRVVPIGSVIVALPVRTTPSTAHSPPYAPASTTTCPGVNGATMVTVKPTLPTLPAASVAVHDT